MAEISKFEANGAKYDLKDATARKQATDLENRVGALETSNPAGVLQKTAEKVSGFSDEPGSVKAYVDPIKKDAQDANRRVDYLCGGFDDGEQNAIKNYIDAKVSGAGGGGSANTAELEGKVATLEQQMANLLYTAISVTSFGHDADTKEYGQTVSAVTLSWAINKTPTALTLDGEALDVSARSKALTGLSITEDNNKTWKLVATDERGATSEKTTSITFCNGVYYGVGAARASYDSAFVLGLTKNLRNSKLSPVTVTAGEGQYIFYCLPKRMGTCAFSVGGFEGGFELAATISFKNASGYTEDYYIYKSVNANLGKTTVYIS